MRHVIVVGGGASGLVAAITAAREGAKVTLIEQKDRVGKKILSTGNGRCNLTNEYMDISCFRGDDLTIVEEVLKQFDHIKTITFFEELGVMLHDRKGYVYPISDQASTILDVLRMELDRQKVRVLLSMSVSNVRKTAKGFEVKTAGETIHGDAVILATGGKAAKVLGSDGSGYTLAKSVGHHISPVVPALVQLIGKSNNLKQVEGVRTRGRVSIYVDHKFASTDEGELQLTDYGISGIPVFQVSRFAAKALYEKKRVTAELDFLPHMNEQELMEFIDYRLKNHGEKTAESFLIGMFHKKLGMFLLKTAGISLAEKASVVPKETWIRFVKVCKAYRMEIVDTKGFDSAQICAGGVKTIEIDCKTMESLCMSGLYLTGELMDVDGICGGYNLQWAWSTGFIAGTNAAKGK